MVLLRRRMCRRSVSRRSVCRRSVCRRSVCRRRVVPGRYVLMSGVAGWLLLARRQPLSLRQTMLLGGNIDAGLCFPIQLAIAEANGLRVRIFRLLKITQRLIGEAKVVPGGVALRIGRQ